MKKYVAPQIRSERLELGVFGCYSGGFKPFCPRRPRFQPPRGHGRGGR